jgi:hypothetical protein
MTRKHFVLITSVFREAYTAEDQLGVRAVAYRMADALARTNPRFDRARFLKACGIE